MRRDIYKAWMVACGLWLMGCTSAKQRPDELPALVASNPALRAQFDAARALLEQGQWQQGADAMRLVQTDAGDDPVGALAEVFIARAALMSLLPNAQGQFEGAKAAPGAATTLARLAADEGVDERVRYLAQLYLASARMVAGQRTAALSALDGYPSGAAMSPLALQRDAVALWSILLERAHRGGAPEETLQIAAALYDAALAACADGSPDGKTPEGGAALYARARAMEAARRVDVERLEEVYFTKEHPLWRAAAGDAVVRARLGQSVESEEARRLEDILAQTAEALVKIGAVERAAELSGLVATATVPPRLVVGLLVPLSGPGKAAGERALRGALLAAHTFEVGGRTGGVTLLVRDATGDAAANIAAMKAAGALAAVGPLDRDAARAHGQAAQAAALPLITLSSEPLGGLTRPAGPAEPGHVYRYFATFEEEARGVARVSAQRFKDRRVAVLIPDMAYGEAMAAAFIAEHRAQGGQIILEARYARKATDYTKLAREVAAKQPDAVYIPDTGGKVAEVAAFLARENVWGLPGAERPEGKRDRVWVHYLGTSLWQDEALLRQASAYVRGALIPAWYATALGGEANQRFLAQHMRVWGASASPGLYEAYSYDAVSWLVWLVEEGGVRGEMNLRRALVSRDWQGVTGQTRFDVSGEPVRALRFVQVGAKGLEELVGVEVRSPGKADDARP